MGHSATVRKRTEPWLRGNKAGVIWEGKTPTFATARTLSHMVGLLPFCCSQAEGVRVAPFDVFSKYESQLPKYFYIRFEAAICDHEGLAASHIST